MDKKEQDKKELKYEDLSLPTFTYSTKIGRIGSVDLDMSDALKAFVLSGLSGIVVGHSETGKSYFGKLVNKHYFGNNGILIQGASMEENSDLITQIAKKINLKEANVEVDIDILNKPYWLVEEIGAIPKPLQSSFYPVGDGILPHQGKQYPLGTELGDGNRYFSLLATSNSINGEDKTGEEYGNFGITRATASRFHLCFDLRHYSRTKKDLSDMLLEDREFINPRHSVSSGKENQGITDKILQAYKNINKSASNPSLEELAAWQLISMGTSNCINGSPHQKIRDSWEHECPECNHSDKCKSKFFNAYELLRTQDAVRIYANALAYTASLKDPNAEISASDAIFTAAKFALAGKVGLVNPNILREYNGAEGKLIEDAINGLREEYGKNEDYIHASLEEAKKGNVFSRFFEYDGAIGDYSLLSKEKQKKVKLIEPYTDNGSIGLSHMTSFLEGVSKKYSKKKEE
ncbi:MAG: hypothetical protein KKE23_04480 [Nanoarchaeota archaeon]|nr:hypothetical protein [Nanoarchaeota archaeon]